MALMAADGQQTPAPANGTARRRRACGSDSRAAGPANIAGIVTAAATKPWRVMLPEAMNSVRPRMLLSANTVEIVARNSVGPQLASLQGEDQRRSVGRQRRVARRPRRTPRRSRGRGPDVMQVDPQRQQHHGDEDGDAEQQPQHVVVDRDEDQQSQGHARRTRRSSSGGRAPCRSRRGLVWPCQLVTKTPVSELTTTAIFGSIANVISGTASRAKPKPATTCMNAAMNTAAPTTISWVGGHEHRF